MQGGPSITIGVLNTASELPELVLLLLDHLKGSRVTLEDAGEVLDRTHQAWSSMLGIESVHIHGGDLLALLAIP